MRSSIALVLLAAIAMGACAAQPAPVASEAVVAAPKQVFVIRHLQKAQGDDPGLTAEGSANAQRLAAMLDDKGIAAIFASPTNRAIQTAEPLARRLGLAITPYDPRDPAALVAAVAVVRGPVLVVGHSNTVPDLVDRFGGPAQPPLGEGDYGTLFVVGADGDVESLPVR